MQETSKMLKRHKQRFLGELHVDQQKLRAQLEVLRSDVEAFAELGDIVQVMLTLPKGGQQIFQNWNNFGQTPQWPQQMSSPPAQKVLCQP